MSETPRARKSRGTSRRRAASTPSPRPPAAAPDGALERLERLLHVLPLASRDGGARLADLAGQLGVDEQTILEDVAHVRERSYSLPAGSPDITLSVDGQGRIRAWTPGLFRRPVKLSPTEALALDLGLRMAALSGSVRGDGKRRALRERLSAHLAARIGKPDSGTPRERGEATFAAPDLEPADPGVRERVSRAAAERRPCRITYLKPRGAAPEARRLHPYLVAYAEGRWYVLGHCETSGETRTFRLDRILDVSIEEGTFDEDPGFDPARHLARGRVFRGGDVVDAVVRYSPRVARWIAEREPGEWTEDGGFLARHPVADPGWLVRHVLQYAGEAEVVEPEALREAVAEAARRAAAAHG